MSEALRVEGDRVRGEVSIAVQPGERAKSIDAKLDALLRGPLADAAEAMGLVVAAAPRRYAKPRPGRDDEGRVRYAVCGRAEADRLVPASDEG